MRRLVVPLAVMSLVIACREPAQPDTEPVRTLLYYREDTGQNFLLNSDGSGGRAVPLGRDSLVPIGLSTAGGEVAFLDGLALVIGRVIEPLRLDTLLPAVPESMSLVAFSPDDRYVAFYRYAPEAGLVIIDRAGKPEIIQLSADVVPVLPPAFSPDGTRIALVSLNDLSAVLTVVRVDGSAPPEVTERLGFSRFTQRLVFGWPRWTDEGLWLGTVRDGDTWDTVAVLGVDPDEPGGTPVAQWTVPGPRLAYDVHSSYALSADGRAIVLAAVPPIRGGRSLYYGAADGALTRLIDDPAALPTFPLILP